MHSAGLSTSHPRKKTCRGGSTTSRTLQTSTGSEYTGGGSYHQTPSASTKGPFPSSWRDCSSQSRGGAWAGWPPHLCAPNSGLASGSRPELKYESCDSDALVQPQTRAGAGHEGDEASLAQECRGGRPHMPRRARLPPNFWATLNKPLTESRPSMFSGTLSAHPSSDLEYPAKRSSPTEQSRLGIPRHCAEAKHQQSEPLPACACSTESSPETYSPDFLYSQGVRVRTGQHVSALPSPGPPIYDDDPEDDPERFGAESLLLLSRNIWADDWVFG